DDTRRDRNDGDDLHHPCLLDGRPAGPDGQGRLHEAPGRPDALPGPRQSGRQQPDDEPDGDLQPGREARAAGHPERLDAGAAGVRDSRRARRAHRDLHRHDRRLRDRRRQLGPAGDQGRRGRGRHQRREDPGRPPHRDRDDQV
ncbi:MAG: Flagellar basal-body rod modification protein FlgD, partial [uncultured Blastococcus sp.]